MYGPTMIAHLFFAASMRLCPPYFLNRLPPIKAISAKSYKESNFPVALIIIAFEFSLSRLRSDFITALIF